MNFKNWLLLSESIGISQSLKQIKDSEGLEKKKNFEATYNIVSKSIQGFPPNVSNDLKRIYTNYFTWNFLIPKQLTKMPSVRMTIDQNIPRRIDSVKDYLIANKDNNQLKSRLNNSEFSIEKLEKESENWHEELKAKKAKPARESETFIDLSHLGSQWQGWRWVSLDRSYCEMEKESAGHCGNAGYVKGDNIFSLRDPQNIAHLTFIENKGVLGEMKGRNNTKPSPRYHVPIIELLKNDKIKSIRGGGYLQENNFSLDDLKNKEALLKIKPNLNFSVYRKEFIDSLLKLPDKEKLSEIESILDERFILDEEHNDFVYSTFENIEEFLSWMAKYTGSNIEKNLNYGFLDELLQDPFNLDIQISDSEIKEGIESLDEENFNKIKNLAKYKNISLEEPEDIIELEDSPFKDEIIEFIRGALRNSYEQSYLDEYWDDFKSSFESNEDKEYLLNKIYSSNDIRIVLNKKLLNNILINFDAHDSNQNFTNLLSDIKYTYYPKEVYPNLDKNSFNEYIKSSI